MKPDFPKKQAKPTIEEKATVLLHSIKNAYLNEEERHEIKNLDINNFNIDDITAMLIAINKIYNASANTSKGLIEFTHLLNVLAIEYTFVDEVDEQ